LANNFEMDSIVELASVSQENIQIENTELEEVVLVEEENELSSDFPIEFRSGSTKSVLGKVEIGNRNDFKEIIFNEDKVLILLDNQYLKNPYIPFEDTFLVVLTGYNQTHFFSDGREVGRNNFTYEANDLMKVFNLSGSQAWILN
jgi:hypothetical protein